MIIRNPCLNAAAVSLLAVLPAAAHEDEKKHDMPVPGMAAEDAAADRETILLLDEWPTGHKHLHGGGMD